MGKGNRAFKLQQWACWQQRNVGHTSVLAQMMSMVLMSVPRCFCLPPVRVTRSILLLGNDLCLILYLLNWAWTYSTVLLYLQPIDPLTCPKINKPCFVRLFFHATTGQDGSAV